MNCSTFNDILTLILEEIYDKLYHCNYWFHLCVRAHAAKLKFCLWTNKTEMHSIAYLSSHYHIIQCQQQTELVCESAVNQYSIDLEAHDNTCQMSDQTENTQFDSKTYTNNSTVRLG